jgi:hypothetical protein
MSTHPVLLDLAWFQIKFLKNTKIRIRRYNFRFYVSHVFLVVRQSGPFQFSIIFGLNPACCCCFFQGISRIQAILFIILILYALQSENRK